MGELESSEGSHSDEKRTSKDEEGFKGLRCSIGTMDGAKANVCDSITQPLAVQMGKQCGLAMKKLVEKGVETDHEKPPFPEKGGEEEEAIWKMKVKTQQDDLKEHKNEEEKVFSGILQKCDDRRWNRLFVVRFRCALWCGANCNHWFGRFENSMEASSSSTRMSLHWCSSKHVKGAIVLSNCQWLLAATSEWMVALV